jgi:hypothetical protein
VAARVWGEETPPEPEFSGGDNEEEDEDGEEGEVTQAPIPYHLRTSLAW